jgi:DNA-binding NarL/FixJ family response regulator
MTPQTRIGDNPTEEELTVLALYAAGRTRQEIAAELNLSLRSVGYRLHRLCHCTQTTNSVAAVREGMRRGWIR